VTDHVRPVLMEGSSSSSASRPPAGTTPMPSGSRTRTNPILSEQQVDLLKQDPWLNEDPVGSVIESKAVHPDDMILCHLFCACFDRKRSPRNQCGTGRVDIDPSIAVAPGDSTGVAKS